MEERQLSEAARLFPNQGMHRNAEFIAALHPRAIDYLRQAPVLAAAFGTKVNTKADRLYVAMRIGGLIERGERLRSVMHAVGIPAPLRKLSGFAVTPMLSKFVRELADLPPSTLSQAIPEAPGDQRKWLAELRDYRRRMSYHYASPRLGFQWIARHAHLCERGQAGDIADYVFANQSVDFGRWSFARMANEVELWHDRLAADRSLERYGLAIKPDTVIDLSDWPEHIETEHFEFFKLATPGMLMEEGRRMRHCVASYIGSVMSGGCHLYSMRTDMRRVATVQITGDKVAQIKGFANRQPAQSVIAAAGKFAREHRPA
jgi:hypothetical protein